MDDSKCHSQEKRKRDKKESSNLFMLASLVNTMSTSLKPNLSISDSISPDHAIQTLKWKERE